MIKPPTSAGNKPGHMICPESNTEIQKTQCLECEKFKIWNNQDTIRCYHEYRYLKSIGYYTRTPKPRPRLKPPGPRRGGGKRINIHREEQTRETRAQMQHQTQPNGQINTVQEENPMQQHQPQEPETQNQTMQTQLPDQASHTPAQELDLNSQWAIIWQDITTTPQPGSIDIGQDIQQPSGHIDTPEPGQDPLQPFPII